VAKREAIFRAPFKGEVWQLTGQLVRHPNYGRQLYVSRSKLMPPSGRLIVRYLSSHPLFRGIGVGQAKASRLYREFGNELTSILDSGKINELASVLGEEAAERLVTAWQINAKESAVVTFLDGHGINAKLVNKILCCWPEDPLGKIRENPYRLLAITDWSTADRVAGSLGVDADDERRLIAAAETAVYDRLDTAKNTLIESDELKENVGPLLGCLGEGTPAKAVELAINNSALVGDTERGYQSLGCALMEQYLMRRFKAIALLENTAQRALFSRKPDAPVIDSFIKEFERKEGIILNAGQRAVVHTALTEPLSLLIGGAGVGKTTTLKAIHHAAEEMGRPIMQLALAGRAAQRMRETTNREAYTIAGFLHKIRAGKIEISPKHLLIVDESSMLDLMLVYRLMKALPLNTSLLFVGDPHQLPPIGPGLIFHKMSESQALPVRELSQVYRQAEVTGIPKVAGQIRNGSVPELPKYTGLGQGVSFLGCREDTIISHLVDIVGDLGGFEEAQILGVTKSGQSGVFNINQAFHRKLARGKRKLVAWELAESDPVIYTVNDYNRELYNGSLGRIKKVILDPQEMEGEGGEPVRLICDFDGRTVNLSDADLGDIELAYAITVHKAQGSQFKRVIIPIVKSRLLDRTLIYTALTRGIEQVVFIGNKKVFNEAIIKRPSVTLRKVGFSM
jgi:exodeoxyribonuclease V alpha subunit